MAQCRHESKQSGPVEKCRRLGVYSSQLAESNQIEGEKNRIGPNVRTGIDEHRTKSFGDIPARESQYECVAQLQQQREFGFRR